MRPPIFIKSTYKFDVQITVAGVAPTLGVGDTITAYLDKTLDKVTPAITSVGTPDAETDGLVHFELTPTDTAVPPGTYYLQVAWVPSGTTERHIVADETVEINKVNKN